MTEKISSEHRLPLSSPRTEKYVEAMIREGDNFDYRKWLQGVRMEETEAMQVPAVPFVSEFVPLEIADLTKPLDRPTAGVNCKPVFQPKRQQVPTTFYCSDRELNTETPGSRLRRELEKVSDAWVDFQENRARDAVYGYLKAVFAVVVGHKGRRRTKRLLRRFFQFAGLPFEKNADPFATVIRCTCDRDVDNKTISKWARALRYVACFKRPRTGLKAFMKAMGGVNACADRYTRYIGRGRR